MGRLLDLFLAALMPVLKVLLITGVGTLLATDFVDILGADARKHVNNIAFFVFNPALVGSNLAKYITLGRMVKLWFMPINTLLTFVVGSVLGLLLIKITGAPNDLHGLMLGCCATGNLGNLPFIIVPAICKERGSPFGDAEICRAQGLAYVSLSMALGAIYMWTYVYNMMRIYASYDSKETKLDALTEGTGSGGEALENPSNGHQGLLLPLKESSTDEKHMIQIELACTESEEKAKVPVLDSFKHGLHIVRRKLNLRRLFAPSTIGAIAGFIVGTIPPLRKVLIGDSAPFHVVEDTVYFLGEAAIPTVTLIIGANLLKGLKKSAVQLSIVIGIVVVRYILLPIFGVLVLKFAVHFGLVHSDPLYQFVLLLQFTVPPAMNIATMVELFGKGQTECSVILLWTYSLASIVMTLWSAFFMWLVG